MNIPIFLASDENYAPFLCTTLYSILEHTKSFIDFYVLDGGIEANSKGLIEKSLRQFNNYSIKYFNMTEFDLERFPNIRHYSLNTFSRYFIPQLTPDIEKAIYIDVDVIVNGDIAELYNIDLENFALASVPENFYQKNGEYVKEHIKYDFDNTENYFNAGVMLLNIKQFIENNYSDELIQMTIEYFDKLSCPDQDIFNILFENNHKLIDYKFNYMPDFYDSYKNILNENEVEYLNNNAIIYHYTCDKPWKSKLVRKFDLFWNIAKQTYFYDRILNIYKRYNNFYRHWYERIFSVINKDNHKVITFLGIKVCIKK